MLTCYESLDSLALGNCVVELLRSRFRVFLHVLDRRFCSCFPFHTKVVLTDERVARR